MRHWIEAVLICEACYDVHQYSVPVDDPKLKGSWLCPACDYQAANDTTPNLTGESGL